MIREILQKVQDHEISVSKAMELLGKDPYSPVEAKATAEGSLVESVWLGSIDLDRVNPGKYELNVSESLTPTNPRGAAISRPASPAVEELVRYMKMWWSRYKHGAEPTDVLENELMITLAKYDNAKGGK